VLDAGFLFQVFITYSVLTKTYIEIGKLKLALITCQKAIDLDREYESSLSFAKYAYILMGEVLYQSGQLDSAETYIEEGLEQVVGHGEVFSIIEGYSTLILIQFANGDPDQAMALNKELIQVIDEIPSHPNSLAILNAWNARFQLMLGNCDQADILLKQAVLEKVDDQYMFDIGSFSYVGIYRVSQTPIRVYLDFLELTKARVFLCQGQYTLGIEAIDQIFGRIAAVGNSRYEIEALIIKSLLLLKMNKTSQAVEVIQKAIRLAYKEDYIQVFLNEGIEIQPLIEAVKENQSGDIEERVFILKLWENLQGKLRKQQRKSEDRLVQLTPREIEVLTCLASGTSYSEAAEALSISRNTLKTHTKRIYQKLGVNGLLQALNKAKRLNLIT
jgi:ATP/maltotriose-dependent transcriptional regulator MalT